ncbi:hypothetical protein AMTRI_Chr09g39920 [Amborella trichopoda]
MMGSFVTRALVLALGYTYPAYACFKTVEKNKPEIDQLRFWCQYWIIVAMLTVFERVGDTFVSWVPMYSEAKVAFLVYLWYPKTLQPQPTSAARQARPPPAPRQTPLQKPVQRQALLAQNQQPQPKQDLNPPAPTSSETEPKSQPQRTNSGKNQTAPSTSTAEPMVNPTRTHSGKVLTGPSTSVTESTGNPPQTHSGKRSGAPESSQLALPSPSQSEAEEMEVESVSSRATDAAQEELLMDETIRVTRGRLRKIRRQD